MAKQTGNCCLIAPDGKLCICPRTESDKMIGEAGYLHILGRGKRVKIPKQGKKKEYPINWEALNEFYKSQLESVPEPVPNVTHINMDIGYDGKAITYPMRNEHGEIVGIQRIFPDRKKSFVKGSKNGLFIRSFDRNDYSWRNSIVVVCEGLSDTITALELGYQAIGRASCNSGGEMICNLVKNKGIKNVLIIADNDKPGIRGAENLMLQLLDLNVNVNMIIPPCKDLKESVEEKGKEKIKILLDRYIKIWYNKG